jgi:hypothetical protein
MENKDQIKSKILELTTESEHGSWEFWSDAESKIQEEAALITQSIQELVGEGKIHAVEYESVADRTYRQADFDIERLEREVEQSMHSEVNPHAFYWFVSASKV